MPDPINDALRWLVQGEDVRNGVFANRAQGDPGIGMVESIASDVVVVTMQDATAEQIQREFSGRLIIERDRILDPP